MKNVDNLKNMKLIWKVMENEITTLKINDNLRLKKYISERLSNIYQKHAKKHNKTLDPKQKNTFFFGSFFDSSVDVISFYISLFSFVVKCSSSSSLEYWKQHHIF